MRIQITEQALAKAIRFHQDDIFVCWAGNWHSGLWTNGGYALGTYLWVLQGSPG